MNNIDIVKNNQTMIKSGALTIHNPQWDRIKAPDFIIVWLFFTMSVLFMNFYHELENYRFLLLAQEIFEEILARRFRNKMGPHIISSLNFLQDF